MKKNALFSPPNKVKLYEEIVDQFKTTILSRSIVTGEKLPSERKMSEIFNINLRDNKVKAIRPLDGNTLGQRTDGRT